MFGVTVRFENGERWNATYNEFDCAIGVCNEVSEFGGDGCVVDTATGEVLYIYGEGYQW